MRIINLDDTGIKMISSTKHQMYLSVDEVKKFIKKKYKLDGNKLIVNEKSLQLSAEDVKEFPSVLNYLKSHFE